MYIADRNTFGWKFTIMSFPNNCYLLCCILESISLGILLQYHSARGNDAYNYFVNTSSQRVKVAVLSTISARNFVVIPAFDLAWQEIEYTYPDIEFMRMTVDSPPEHQGDCDYFVDGIGDNVGKFWTEDSGAEYWVMLSSACTPGITEQAAFAREWNCLFLSSAGAGSDLGNKALFPTLIRFSPNLSKEYAMCLKQLLAYYNWNHVTMLCDSDDVADIALEDATLQACNDFRTIMADLRTQSGYSMYDLLVNLTDSASRVAALKTARGYSKIILIIARMEKVRMTMISAWDLGMISEDFAYITFVPFPGDSTTRGHWGWQRNDSSDEVARQAYESLLFVSLSGLKITPLLRSLFLYVEQQASEKYNKSQVMKYQQNQRLAMASFLIARAAAQMMNETIQLGWNHSDGREIYRRMLDRQFLSFDESPVYINPNGDRSELYAVWGYTNYTEDLEEVLFYDVYRNRIFPAHNDSRWIREDTIPDSRPLCEFAVTSTDCQESDGAITLRICLSVLIPSIAVLAALIIGCLRSLAPLTGRYRYVQSAKAQLWILSCSQMEYPSRRSPVVPPLAPTMSRSKVSFMRLASVTPSAHASVQQSEFRARNRVFYKGDAVWIKTYEYTQGQYSKLVGTEHERLCTRKLMLHQNIIQFYGVVFHSDHLEIVTEFAPKGSLEEILDAEAFSSQIDLKYSFIHDLVSGLGYIQASPLGIHGNLKATNCLIDRFLTLKLTDFGLEIITNNAKKLLPEESGEWNSLYLAPEILKQLSTKVTDKSEIYSFGILLHQILFECLPFGIKNALYKRGKEEMSSMVVQAILEKVRINQDPPFRPTVLLDTYDKNLIQMMKSCWQDDPEKRPSMHRISKFIVTIPGLDKQISYTEAVMHRLQSFADELMREVNLRTKEYKQQKRNADHILYQIIPKYIVEKLQQGEDVPPEMFDEVTVCFTAVANFAHIVSISHPLEVGTFLNATFHLLDSIIRTFNVYKVETVSDTYMVVSGLPERNGQRHSAEIAKMALCILGRCEQPQLRLGRHQGPLLLKFGMHTGSCAAAVIGTKMPRYCLFGDTVNTASRMTSFGQGLKIHVSVDAAEHLSNHHANQFILLKRGLIDVKGKGQMSTYWLVAHNPLPAE